MKIQALYNRQTVPGSTAALQILLVAAFAVAGIGCATDDDTLDLLDTTSSGGNSYTTTYTGDWNGNAGNFTSSFSPTLTGDVLSFSVAFDDSDAATYGSATETAPTDKSDTDYEDYAENFTERCRITITYADGSATASGDVGEVAIDINGADVAVTSETKGVTYVLTGSCSDGSFKMVDGEDDKKFGLILQDLTLAKAGGAAINIQPSKRCYLQVEGTNTLSNTGTFTSDEEQQKGCIFSEGKLLISGSGTLNVSSAEMHAVASDDYVWIHSGPTLHLTSQAKDGIHANDSVVVTGGKTYITSYGDGIQVDEATGNYVQKGGFVRITASSSNADRSHGVKTAGSALNDIVVMLLGLTVGCSTQASEFLTLDTIKIFALGAFAFIIATASGVIFVHVMNLFLSKDNKINPLIGNAGVSAVPMAARISQNEGLKADPHNYLLMHAMGPNVAGVIGSAVAAGVLLGFLS